MDPRKGRIPARRCDCVWKMKDLAEKVMNKLFQSGANKKTNNGVNINKTKINPQVFSPKNITK